MEGGRGWNPGHGRRRPDGALTSRARPPIGSHAPLTARMAPVRFEMGALLRVLPSLRVFHVALGIAKLCLRGAHILVDVALDLLGLVADHLAGKLLHLSRHFFGSPFNLIFVNTHSLLLKERRQTADTSHRNAIIPGGVLRLVGWITDRLSENSPFACYPLKRPTGLEFQCPWLRRGQNPSISRFELPTR